MQAFQKVGALIFLAWAFAAPAMAQEARILGASAAAGKIVEISDRADTVFAAGDEVRVSGMIGGSVFAAGRDISVTGPVRGDVRAMGEDVRVTAPVGGAVSLAGQHALLDAPAQSAHLAGESIETGEAAEIEGVLRAAGESVTLRGRVGGNVDAAGEIVVIDAAIAGDVSVRARRVSLGPNAAIGGRLSWRAAEPPAIDPAAKTTGGVDGAVQRWNDRTWRRDISPEAQRFFSAAARTAMAIGLALAALLIGSILAFAAPGFFDRAAAGLRTRPLPALLWGLLLIFAPLAAAIILFATLIGIPLGLLTLFAYPLFLAAGFALGAAGFGALAVRGENAGARLGALALGVLVISALSFAPVFGGAILGVVLVMGLGLFVIGLRRESAEV
ncbi:MAG: hypothetical protein AB7O04_14180 [Hyphomonadaceae bacterium]